MEGGQKRKILVGSTWSSSYGLDSPLNLPEHPKALSVRDTSLPPQTDFLVPMRFGYYVPGGNIYRD